MISGRLFVTVLIKKDPTKTIDKQVFLILLSKFSFANRPPGSRLWPTNQNQFRFYFSGTWLPTLNRRPESVLVFISLEPGYRLRSTNRNQFLFYFSGTWLSALSRRPEPILVFIFLAPGYRLHSTNRNQFLFYFSGT